MSFRKNYNFSLRKDVECNDGDEFHDCNFTQTEPNTVIFSGKKNLKFFGCNLTNCKVPPGSILVECNNTQKEYCYWLHPEFNLPVEKENCKHVVKVKEVDGKIGYIREE